MKKSNMSLQLSLVTVIIVLVAFFVTNCGGGPSTSSGVVPAIPTNTVNTDPTSVPVPTGNIDLTLTDQNRNTLGGFYISYLVLQAAGKIEGSALSGSYNTEGIIQLDSNGHATLTGIPLNTVVHVEAASTNAFTDVMATRNIIFNTDGQVEVLVQNQNEPTPNNLTPYPTQQPTPTPNPNQPTNTPAPGSTNTPTPAPGSTNTPTPPPGSTSTPTPAPGSTYTPTPTNTNTPIPDPNATITNVKDPLKTGYDEQMVPPGTIIDIIGTNFGASQGGGTVYIGGFLATPIISWSNTLIKATVPAGALTGTAQLKNVVVTTNTGKTASWGELFVNSDLQVWRSSAVAMQDITVNATGDAAYYIHAPTSITKVSFPDPNSAAPITTTFVGTTSFLCYNSDNNRPYVSTEDIENWNSSLGDHNQVTSLYSNAEGIRWHPVLKKIFLVVGSKLYSFKTDGTDHQTHYTDPSDITSLDIDSDGYIYLTANTRVISLNPDFSISNQIVNVGLANYIYCKKIDANTKLLFVTTAESGTGFSSITVIKIKNDNTKTVIKKIIMPNDSYTLSGIHGHDGKIVVVDENLKNIYMFIF
jgi:hypothetical protein